MIIEHNFTKEVMQKIHELDNLYFATDSRDLQNKYQWQSEILRDFVLPIIAHAEFNLNELSACENKKSDYIKGLLDEINSLKGELQCK